MIAFWPVGLFVYLVCLGLFQAICPCCPKVPPLPFRAKPKINVENRQPHGKECTMRRGIGFFVLVLTLAAVLSEVRGIEADKGGAKGAYDYYHEWAEKNLPKGEREAPEDVRHEFDEFVEGVKAAMKGENAAKERKDVVDLGQSLSILESKFSRLRNSIFRELGGSKGDKPPVDTATLHTTTTTIVRQMMAQREKLKTVSEDMESMQKVVMALGNNLQTLEKDIATVTGLLQSLHESHEDLRGKMGTQFDTVMRHGAQIKNMGSTKSGHLKFYMFVVFEMTLLAVFAFLRRRSARSNKYNKMG